MATFIALTSSNEARIIDGMQARDILDRYLWDSDVQPIIRDDEEGLCYLSLSGEDWPSAWRVPDDVHPEDFVPDWDQDSEEGFERFLKEIAQVLAEPLTVQAIGAQACHFPLVATEWRVKPGPLGRVRTSGFRWTSPVLVAH